MEDRPFVKLFQSTDSVSPSLSVSSTVVSSFNTTIRIKMVLKVMEGAIHIQKGQKTRDRNGVNPRARTLTMIKRMGIIKAVHIYNLIVMSLCLFLF